MGGPTALEPPPQEQVDLEVEAVLDRSNLQGARRWRWAVVGVVVVLVIGWAFVAGRSLGRDPTQVRSALIGKPVPSFRLPALGGGVVDSASFRGEVLIVNFWASWCMPCRQEAPDLEAFAQQWSDDDVNLVGIVYSDSESAASAFRDEFALTYLQVMDPGGRAAIDFGVFGVPETYVIDRRGIVMAKLIGAVDAATLEGVVNGVEDGRTATSRNDDYRTRPGTP